MKRLPGIPNNSTFATPIQLMDSGVLRNDIIRNILFFLCLLLLAMAGTSRAKPACESGCGWPPDSTDSGLFQEPALPSFLPGRPGKEERPGDTPVEEPKPLYFFLFTHTEDPFNHELSEERYLRLVPEVEARAQAYPEAHLKWTIMFQGTDARSVAERNHLGAADLLRDANEQGLVHFGYHAHHEATYENRPQNNFTGNSSWEEMVEGMIAWLSCLKDVATGDCLEPQGGGIMAVEELLGPVEAVSGDFLRSGEAYEGAPTVHAVRKILPDRVVGFGFPDHGPFADEEKRQAVARLMEHLTPTDDTSSSLYWADHVLKINGGVPVDGVAGIDPLRGPVLASHKLQALDRSRPHVMLTGLASKYLYTRSGMNTSPTKYGYVHPEDPALPPELLNSESEKDALYQASLDTLDYLLNEVLPDNPGSRFIDAVDLINMVAPPDYWLIDEDRLRKMAAWLLLYWTDRPPDWVSDGHDFYSLADLFALLGIALRERYDYSPASTHFEHSEIPLPLSYGPFEAMDAENPVLIPTDEIIALSRNLASDFTTGPAWQLRPSYIIQPGYTTSRGAISAAQLLYGMASLYVNEELTARGIRLPATRAMPATHDLLLYIGCLNTCTGTAWSFKPAPIRVSGHQETSSMGPLRF